MGGVNAFIDEKIFILPRRVGRVEVISLPHQWISIGLDLNWFLI